MRELWCARLAAALLLAWSLGSGRPLPVPGVSAQAAYADGDLVQARGDEKLYIIRRGQRVWIADTLSLRRLNPDMSRLKQLSFEELDRIPPGKPLSQGPLIRGANGRTYLLTRETDWPAPRKHWINDPDSFARLGFDWADVQSSWPTPAEQYADAPALSYRPLSREQTSVATASGQLTLVPAWQLQVGDDRLLQALGLANTYNQVWREQIAPRLVARGTWIDWGDLDQGTSGQFLADLNAIRIDPKLQVESLGVLAALLSHEVFHAVQDGAQGMTAEACLAAEANAFAHQVTTWTALPARFRSASRLASQLDVLAETAAQSGLTGLQRAVSENPQYRTECASFSSFGN